MNNPNPLLTISLLASNRPDTIRKCLDSLRGIREAIACELILVDTSQSEEIHSILCEYTDRVYPFEWCKDFSKARNVGLKKARGEWFLFLDDDEWFIDSEDIIEFFRSGEYKNYGYANYMVRNYMDIHYSSYSDGYVTRMIRLEEDTEFKSKIHEYLAPIRGARKDLSALVGHSGYIYETEEKKRAHFRRNYELLQDMMLEEPDNVRWKMQMAQELSAIGEWEMLISFCQKQIEDPAVQSNSYDSVYGNPALGTFYAGCMTGYWKLERYQDGIDFAKCAIECPRNTQVLRAFAQYNLAQCYYGLREWSVAEEYITLFLEQREALLQEDELMRLHKMVALLSDVADENSLKAAYHLLICIGLRQNRTTELRKYYAYLGLENTVVTLSEDTLNVLFESLGGIETEAVLVRLLNDAYQNNGLRTFFSTCFRECICRRSARDMVDLKLLAGVYSKSSAPHGDMFFAKAYLELDGVERDRLMELYLRKKELDDMVKQEVRSLPEEQVIRLFNDYMAGVLEYYLYVCPEECFEELDDRLPDEAKGAMWLNQMYGRDVTDAEGKLEDLKKCAKYLPELGEQMKRLAECIVWKKNSSANDQMLQMVMLMKDKIQLLIAQGMRKEALDIVRQVRALAPWDVELAELEDGLKEI